MEIKSKFLSKVLSKFLTGQVRKKLGLGDSDIWINQFEIKDENPNDGLLHVHIDADVDISKKDLEELVIKGVMK